MIIIPKNGWHPWNALKDAFREDSTLWVPTITGTIATIVLSLVLIFVDDEPINHEPCATIQVNGVQYHETNCP